MIRVGLSAFAPRDRRSLAQLSRRLRPDELSTQGAGRPRNGDRNDARTARRAGDHRRSSLGQVRETLNDDGPDQFLGRHSRIETVEDDSNLEDVHQTERHLLYAGCTRTRDHLFVTGVSPASEFLEDLCISGAVRSS